MKYKLKYERLKKVIEKKHRKVSLRLQRRQRFL